MQDLRAKLCEFKGGVGWQGRRLLEQLSSFSHCRASRVWATDASVNLHPCRVKLSFLLLSILPFSLSLSASLFIFCHPDALDENSTPSFESLGNRYALIENPTLWSITGSISKTYRISCFLFLFSFSSPVRSNHNLHFFSYDRTSAKVYERERIIKASFNDLFAETANSWKKDFPCLLYEALSLKERTKTCICWIVKR